jgi:DEAD/DEAH box helicase domain-containing protein
MKAIFGLNDVTLIDEDGSPAGKKEFILWNAPLVDPDDRGAGRTSTISETSKLLVFLINLGIRTIAFCKIRKLCDILLRSVRAELRAQQLEHLSDKVMSYRGGYTAQDRRKIEQAMFNGDLLGIIATSALELGVDIGTLDAVLIVGFPYTIAAMVPSLLVGINSSANKVVAQDDGKRIHLQFTLQTHSQ